MNTDMRIWVTGHRGMVGSAFCRRLPLHGFHDLTTTNMDLRDANRVDHFVELERPELIIMCAGRVGGIKANMDHPVDFLDTNLMIGRNIVQAASKYRVELIYLGSSCIYPRECPQPMLPAYLWTGPLEPTNRWYATAKLAVIQMIMAYGEDHSTPPLRATVLIPCNLYGPNDNYHPTGSHVIPALFSKIHNSKRYGYPAVELFGTGKPLREFLYVDDLVTAALTAHAKATVKPCVYNAGSGSEITIRELAEKIADVVGYDGLLKFTSTLDGMPRKVCDSSALRALGWSPQIDLDTGLKQIWERIAPRMDKRQEHNFRL